MQIQLLAPQTGAATKVEFNTFGMDKCTIAASGLAGAERVDLFRNVNGTWVPVVTSAGVAVQLAPAGTAPGPSWELPGGAIYAFDKAITVAASGVNLSFVPNT